MVSAQQQKGKGDGPEVPWPNEHPWRHFQRFPPSVADGTGDAGAGSLPIPAAANPRCFRAPPEEARRVPAHGDDRIQTIGHRRGPLPFLNRRRGAFAGGGDETSRGLPNLMAMPRWPQTLINGLQGALGGGGGDGTK